MPSAAFMPPGNLMDIHALEELDMSQTGLMAFPTDALSMGASLGILKLAGNKISSVPDQVSMPLRGLTRPSCRSKRWLCGCTSVITH